MDDDSFGGFSGAVLLSIQATSDGMELSMGGNLHSLCIYWLMSCGCLVGWGCLFNRKGGREKEGRGEVYHLREICSIRCISLSLYHMQGIWGE